MRPQLRTVLKYADRETGDINVVGPHNSSVLRRLAAEQGRIGPTTGRRDGGHNRRNTRRDDFPHGDDVEQEEWFGPDTHEVIYQHRNEIVADPIESLR